MLDATAPMQARRIARWPLHLIRQQGGTGELIRRKCPAKSLCFDRQHVRSFDRTRSQRILGFYSGLDRWGSIVSDSCVVPGEQRSKQCDNRRMATVLAADVVGYTRLMEADEDQTHARLMNLRFSVLEPIVCRHGGRIVKNTGDGFMAMFDTPVTGLQAAQEMQRAAIAAEAAIPAEQRITFRMGINETEVIVEDHDIYGDGVNVAARLQTHAEPSGIVITGLAADQVGDMFGMRSVDLGQMHLRNRSAPVRILSLTLPEASERGYGEVAPGIEPRPSIAVLPFRKLLTNDDSYFADGIVDNIIQSLAALKDLFVISRGSTLGFGRGSFDMQSVGDALGVRYLLYGSVQRSGDRLRIGTELSDAATGEVIRTAKYDAALDKLFDLQDRIAEEVVTMIAPHIRERELKRALRKHPQNLTAYDLVLQALEPLYRLDYASFSRARGLLQRAIVVDPNFAPAYSYAAWWHSGRIGQSWSNDPAMDSAEAVRLAKAALDRDPDDVLALAVYGHERSYLHKDFEAAIGCFDRGLAASPNSATAWTLKGLTLCFIGDGPGAIRHARQGMRLSPLDQNISFSEHVVGQAYYVNGDYENAVLWSRRAFGRNGRQGSNLRTLISSLVATGQTADVQKLAEQHREVAPDFRILAWAARSPMSQSFIKSRTKRLREAGMPD